MILISILLAEHGITEHLGKLQQTAIGTALLFFGWLIVYLVKKLVFLANHHSTELKEVIIGNTTAITQLGSNLATNTRVSERLERWLEKRG